MYSMGLKKGRVPLEPLTTIQISLSLKREMHRQYFTFSISGGNYLLPLHPQWYALTLSTHTLSLKERSADKQRTVECNSGSYYTIIFN